MNTLGKNNISTTYRMPRLIDLNQIGAKSKQKIRKYVSDMVGFKASKTDLIKLAANMGLNVGVRPKTKESRVYNFFGDMLNEQVLKDYDEKIETEKRKKEQQRRMKKQGKTYNLLDLNGDLLNKQPFKKLFKVEGNKSKPFSLTLISRVASNVKQPVNFINYYHFKRWLQNESKFNGTEKSSSVGTDIIKADTSVWDNFNIIITFVEGGERVWGENKKDITRKITFLNFETKAFDPATTNKGDNNCGIKVLSKLLDTRLNIKKVRKDIDSPAKTLLNADQLHDIYKRNGGEKNMLVIDPQFEGEFNLETTDYILFKDNHYTAIIEATRKDHMVEGNKKQKGRLAFDIETRHTDEIIMVGETESKVLKSAILSMVYKPLRGTKQTKTFVTDSAKNCCVKFLDWLGHEANDGRYYNCVAHNGSRFDFYLIMSYFTEEDLLDSKTQLRGTSIIGLQYKSHTFKDSCCFLTNSLSNLCDGYLITPEEKAFSKLTNIKVGDKTMTNYQLCFYKPELSFDEFLELEKSEPQFWSEYVKYCEYDCESLYLVWEKFKFQIDEIIGKMGMWLKQKVSLNTCNTIGSLSKKLIDTINGLTTKQEKEPTFKMERLINKYKQRNGHWKFGVTKADYEMERDALKKSGDVLYNIVGENISGKPNFTKYIEFMNDDEKYDFIKNFKRGGISHSNQMGFHQEGVCGFDIKSQYPTALMNMKIPVGQSEWINHYDSSKHGFYHIHNICWSEDAKRFKPVANKKENGVLDWSAEKFNDLYCDSYMIKYLLDNCGLVSFDVIKGLVSNEEMCGEKLFGTYVYTLYKEKALQDALKDAKQEYNQPYREAIKLLLNSLTGKLVEDPSRYFKLHFAPETYYDSIELKDGKLVGNWGQMKLDENNNNTKMINKVSALKEDVEKGMNYWLNAGVMVYSYSKRILWDYVNCLPNKADDVIHIETDGIYFGVPNREAFINNLKAKNDDMIKIGEELGNVEEEVCTTEESFFIGKKDYMIGEAKLNKDGSINYGKSKIRNKGIPKTTIDDEGSKIDLLDKQFYIDRYNGDAVSKTFKTIGKSLYDSKRTEGMTLTGYDMTRKSTPHNFKHFKHYTEEDGKVKINEWKKYE